MLRWTCALSALAAGVVPAPAFAQQGESTEAPAPASDDDDVPSDPADAVGDTVVVRAGALRGAVPGDIPPEQQLSPADIRSYGVSSLADLLTELEPQTRSARGRGGGGPVVLLNGRRVSGFREIRDIPVEAIERVDILPEEVALKFGYRADQRVVNVVLRRRFRAITTTASAGMPTAGGNASWEADVDILKIQRDSRLNLDVNYEGNSAILESERGIVSTGGGSLFAPRGNVSGIGGNAIDAALSALAGTPVTVAAVPVSAAAAAPALADFVAGANLPIAFDQTPYRTLVGPSDQLTINGIYSRPLSSNVTASFNASLEATSRESLLGLPGVALTLPAGNPFSPFGADALLYRTAEGQGPLRRASDSQTYHFGFTVNGTLSQWRWSVTGNLERADSATVTQTGVEPFELQARLDARDAAFNPFAPLPALAVRAADTAQSQSDTGSIDALLSGPAFSLPAGKANAALRFSAGTLDYDTRSLRGGVPQSADIGRRTTGAQLNLDFPLIDRDHGALRGLGDLTVNGNAEVERLSDFGTLRTFGYGLNWSPLRDVRLLVSVTDEEGAPSAQQLGDPTVATPNVRVFDFRRGETVTVTSVSGGNPALRADHRSVLKIGLNAHPLSDPDLRLSADYVRTRIRDAIGSLPAATAELETAFPDRFVRDASGALLRVDNRAVNFARVDTEELRWGFNFSMPLTSKIQKRIQQWRAQRDAAEAEGRAPPQRGPFGRRLPPEARGRWQRGQRPDSAAPGAAVAPGRPQEGAAPAPEQAQRPGGWRGGRGGFGGFGGPGGRGGRDGALAGRINASLYHTWRFRNSTLIRTGLPVLDALNGGAAGNRGGTPRHEIDGQLGISKDGLGLRLDGNWKSATRVTSGPGGSGDTLRFSDQTSVGLRLFADLGQQLGLVRRHRWLIGTRISLSIKNLFDARQRITDSSGTVPISYQPDLLDPVGRSVKLEIRKLFF